MQPDLVIMDITMPEVDGIQAVKDIKKMDADAKIIMCSAMGQQAMVIESIQAGAKDFIVNRSRRTGLWMRSEESWVDKTPEWGCYYE